MENWDSPVFKVLARNDTPSAAGHQGGVVIPKDLGNYFPPLDLQEHPGSPTADIRLDADLLLGGKAIGRVSTRYQVQTWGGTRSPERRLTSELRDLLIHAEENDVLIFQRNLSDTRRFRIRLVRRRDEGYEELLRAFPPNRRWGVLSQVPELGNMEVRQAEVDLSRADPDVIFEQGRAVQEITSRSRARFAAFRASILKIYENRCAVTGEGLVSPTGAIGVDAAHLVPVGLDGSDSPRNGIALRKDLHWAFDAGLWTIDESYKVFVPASTLSEQANAPLRKWHQGEIRMPNPVSLSPHPDAIKWRFSHWDINKSSSV